jgi:type II secretory pathway component GspD/PulD (secretin)
MRFGLLAGSFLLAGCCSAPVAESHTVAKVSQRRATLAETAAAPIPTAPRRLVNIEVQDAPLAEVMDMIGRQVGENIVVEPNVHESVTINLRNIDWLEAVEVIAERTKCDIEVVGSGGKTRYVIDPPKVTLRAE